MMKTNNVFLTLFLVGSITFQQEQKQQKNLKKNEIKTNLALHIARKIPITYELILHKNHSVGIDAFYDYDFFNSDYKTTFLLETKYGLRIFYKFYIFNKKYAEGFFLKPMVGVVNVIDNYEIVFSGEPKLIDEIRKSIGFYIGYKFNFSKHFLLEFQGDLTAQFFNIKDGILSDVLGVSLGVRF